MKDISSTTFGFLIAYLLPGITGLFVISLWSEPLGEVFTTFTTSESNIGLFLLVVLFAIVVGLQISIFRWLLYEEWICRGSKLEPEDFKNLGDEFKFAAFRATADEHYRYHQFWGAISIILPFFFIKWSNQIILDASTCAKVGFWLSAACVEIITILAARKALLLYVDRATRILRGA